MRGHRDQRQASASAGSPKSANQSKGALAGLTAEAKLAGTAMRQIGGNATKFFNSGTLLKNGVDPKGLAAISKGIALSAGLALASSGAAESVGLQNTAMFASAGLIAGGWGAAVGGAVGLALDWKAAMDKDAEGARNLRSELHQLASAGDLAGLKRNARSAQPAADFAQAQGGDGIFADIGAQASIPIQGFATITGAISRFNASLTGGNDPVTKLSDLQQVATRMQPAMEKLGLTFDDLLNMNPKHLAETIDHLGRMTTRADAAEGSVRSVAAAFAGMGDKALTADERVQALTTAIDGLLGPGLSVAAASDAFRKGTQRPRRGS
jgi:hypothetical protein